MPINLSINPSKTEDNIVNFIKRTVSRAGFSKVVLGLSGGLDSSVSCALAIRALGVENVYIGLFPYRDLDKEGAEDTSLLIKQLEIPSLNIYKRDIAPLLAPLFALDPNATKLRKGNMTARMRMILLFDMARKLKALVLGTENRTEYLLGYFTRFGDEASDIEPLKHLYKTQVIKLAQNLEIPQQIIDKPPTARLWLGQTDEGEFGFTYKMADQILHLYIDQKKKEKDIIKKGFDKKIVENVIKRLRANAYKMEVPYGFEQR